MARIIISGYNGHMGQVVRAICAGDPELAVVAGFDVLGAADGSIPIFSNPTECDLHADALIDFSAPAALSGLLAFGLKTKTPLVLCTTGYSPDQLVEVSEAAKQIPVFRSANMSLGINVLLDLVKKAAAALTDYDIEMVERHHSRKVDAPSGTALMIANAAASAVDYGAQYVYERQSVRKPRDKREIGISSVRGGTIVGDHQVIFAGRDEVIEITHHAASREIFATGAIKAAKFLASVDAPGMYDMQSLLK